MPRVTFPHMGESYRSFKMLLNDLGNDVVLPPRPSKRTLDHGVRYSPEFACFPLKILMGTYVETCRLGAEIIVTSGGVGPCRAGHYGQMHKKILQDIGFPVDVVVFEPPRFHPIDFLRNIQKLNPDRLSYRAIWDCIKRAWQKLSALDEAEKLTHVVRPRETVPGATTRAYRKALEWIDRSYTSKEISEAHAAALEAIKSVEQDPERKILKVGIVGEIYVLLEPASNLEIEETLGNLGVEVERSMFLTGWTKDNTGQETHEIITVKDAAMPYIPLCIGGHGRESVGHTVIYAKRGFDGVIQMAPFTCIPEIVARTILTSVSREYGIPVLTFFLDEQTGKAGMSTRLEAFVDLMKRKKWQEPGTGQAAVNI
ncbi:(R)-2-hydroxyglutaryl-CoA dehydratase [Desulfocucumis palustris]|uniref:(R)-2-hydroxyglutaryl-CoA dehydratase n=1 Tax=Desulfocucumis palustris TaxID=1898651 RepID=A0A2L2XKA2_9FIRM|nr:CoA protein activase [Desulfocucumis palustris]GBF34331.1 (R)-2-hydroxyglutaryl-CoA dehydratase [Desulfocucumis palustris]